MRSATKTTVSTFSVIFGLAGIEHGIGEILQGNAAPEGLMIRSWPDSPFFRMVRGEPAMTIIPNYLVTGILAVLFSLAFIVCATRFVERKHGSLVMILLSIAMLLLGGGIFPPILGIIAGILATRINSPLTWWRTHCSGGIWHFLGTVWPETFVVCVIGWLCLFPGLNILGCFFGVDNPNLTVLVIGFALGSLVLTIFTGLMHDSQIDARPAFSMS